MPFEYLFQDKREIYLYPEIFDLFLIFLCYALFCSSSTYFRKFNYSRSLFEKSSKCRKIIDVLPRLRIWQFPLGKGMRFRHDKNLRYMAARIQTKGRKLSASLKRNICIQCYPKHRFIKTEITSFNSFAIVTGSYTVTSDTAYKVGEIWNIVA